MCDVREWFGKNVNQYNENDWKKHVQAERSWILFSSTLAEFFFFNTIRKHFSVAQQYSCLIGKFSSMKTDWKRKNIYIICESNITRPPIQMKLFRWQRFLL